MAPKTYKLIIKGNKIEVTGPHIFNKQKFYSLYINNILIYDNLFSKKEAFNYAKGKLK